MKQLKIGLGIISDNHNSVPKDVIEFLSNRDIDTVYIKLGDREVGVDKKELLGAVSLLGE
jgi:hypothetical protein